MEWLETDQQNDYFCFIAYLFHSALLRVNVYQFAKNQESANKAEEKWELSVSVSLLRLRNSFVGT